MEQNPADIYQTETPSTTDLMDTIRDNARNLSDAIKNANKAGISVSIQQAHCSEGSLFNIVYHF